MRGVYAVSAIAMLIVGCASGGTHSIRRAAHAEPSDQRPAAPEIETRTLPLAIELLAYDELPDGLHFTLRGPDGSEHWRCSEEGSDVRPAQARCLGADRWASARGAHSLEIRFFRGAARDAEEVVLIVPLDVDEEAQRFDVRVELAELVQRDSIWARSIRVRRARSLAIDVEMRADFDAAWQLPRFELVNRTTRTLWPVGDTFFRGRVEREHAGAWERVPRRFRVCGNVSNGPPEPLAPGASAWTTEVLAPLGRQPALPSGELRYTVELGEFVAMGDVVERREALRRAPQPFVVDVFTLQASLSAHRP